LACSAALLLALTGCGPTYPKCEKDEHCSEKNEVCVQGQCQECGQDQDCKDGFVCRGNACVPKPECETRADCGACSICSDEKCVPECSSDDQCAEGLECKSGCCTQPPKAECLSDADCPSQMRCQSDRCIDVPKPVCQLQTVNFEYNEYNLTTAARAVLDANVACIRTKSGVVTLAGHADERGTEEYNLHLGEKRANSVKRYLQNLGVSATSLRTVSFGKERPANPASNEAAWAENRRVEFND
jgi:peptidoglycan-associated lipoprotein